jgi:hypothetical protein
MKIIGLVTTVFRDSKTLEVLREKTQQNSIQEEYFKRLLVPSTNFQDTYSNLFLSSENPGKQRINWTNAEIGSARQGVNISGVPSDKVTLDYFQNTHLREFVQRFVAPLTDTDINMIGVCSFVSSNLVSSPDAVVWLSETVIQKTTEILDIFYRIQVIFDNGIPAENFVETPFNLSPGESRKMADSVVSANIHNFHYGLLGQSTRSYLCWHSFDKQAFRKLDFFRNQYSGGSNGSISRMPVYDYSLMKSKAVRSATTADFLGHAISWIGADQDSGGLMQLLKEPETDPVQSVFGHNSLSDTPFYNSENSNLGLGKIQINGTGWTNPDTGKFVYIDVINDGLTGTSTYKFRTQPFFGFVGNTYEFRECFLSASTQTNKHVSSGFAIGRDDYRNEPVVTGQFISSKRLSTSSFFKYKGGYEVLFLWKNEFAIIDVLSCEAVYPPFNNERLFGSAVDPEFLAEDIIQHYVIGDFIYIACGVTGLYKIHLANDTIEKIDSANTGLSGTSGCFGICEGFGGRLYSYFNHTTTPTIYYSDDNGVSWVSSGMVDAEFSTTPKLLMGIQASKTESDGHLAILHAADLPGTISQISVRLSWYNLLTNTVTRNVAVVAYFTSYQNNKVIHGYAEHNYDMSELVTCSPNQGKWAGTSFGSASSNSYYLTFEGGISAPVGVDLSTYQSVDSWIVDKNGNDALLFITSVNQSGNGVYGSGNVIVVWDGAAAEFYGLDVNVDLKNCMYLKNGLWLNMNTNSTPTSTEASQSQGFHANYLKLFVGFAKNDTYASPNSTYGLMADPIYGWNGTAWEAGHPNGKPTHAGQEELFDGVTMAWNDIGGTTQFLASDHYTTSIFNGVVMDGSTSFEFESAFYVKETIELTDVESATFPSSQKISNIMLTYIPQGDADFQDLDSMNTDEDAGWLKGTGTGLDNAYTGRARSANPVIQGGAVSYLPNKCFVPDSDITNAIGWVDAVFYNNVSLHFQMYVGLSDSSVLGTVIDPSTIQYAMHFDSEPGNGGTLGVARLSVVESGIERAFVTGIEYNQSTKEPKFRIILLNTGVMVYQFKRWDQLEWEKLYESPSINQVPFVQYYLDVVAVPKSNYGLRYLNYGSIDPNNADYFVYLGNGVNTGLFDPTFRGIDSDYSKIYIDGQKAVIMNADLDTVLGANRVSIFPYDGVMRYSVDDIGKTVTASCLMVKL